MSKLRNITDTLSLSDTTEVVTILSCIREVPSSKPGQDKDCSD
jgi:hypothetical protein